MRITTCLLVGLGFTFPILFVKNEMRKIEIERLMCLKGGADQAIGSCMECEDDKKSDYICARSNDADGISETQGCLVGGEKVFSCGKATSQGLKPSPLRGTPKLPIRPCPVTRAFICRNKIYVKYSQAPGEALCDKYKTCLVTGRHKDKECEEEYEKNKQKPE